MVKDAISRTLKKFGIEKPKLLWIMGRVEDQIVVLSFGNIWLYSILTDCKIKHQYPNLGRPAELLEMIKKCRRLR